MSPKVFDFGIHTAGVASSKLALPTRIHHQRLANLYRRPFLFGVEKVWEMIFSAFFDS